LHPMRTQRPDARFAMLSTAWNRTDPFWSVWSGDDPTWIKIQATVDVEPSLIAADVVERARRQLTADDFKREYLGVPGGTQVSPFTFDLYERATQIPVHRSVWEYFRPHIIAHDVGRSRDRSTAVVGGNNPFGHQQFGIVEARELPQNLFGSERANALATIDRQYHHNSLIVADLSNDATYAEILVQTFGCRIVGLQITRSGDGMGAERRSTKYGPLWVYTIGRTILLELLHREFQSDLVRLGTSPEIRRGFEQLANLEVEYREGGTVYQCAPGRHDDLGISFAMLNWAAQHPHLHMWMRDVEAARRPRRRPPSNQSSAWAAFT